MGGSKTAPTVVQGLTSCPVCNDGYENSLQATALLRGWKVRRWVADCELIPVYYPVERAWFLLTVEGSRVRLSWDAAIGMMRAVYGATYDVEGGWS